MNELALFAGAGGGLLASKLIGLRTICAIELDEYCRCILVQRQNDRSIDSFPIWDDVRSFDGRTWRGLVDVVSGGFPCQAFSNAAAGKNTADDLWPEMRRIVADVAPMYVFAENVTKKAIDSAADDLESMDFQVKAIAISAKDMGADHIRERYWLLAHSNSHGKLFSAFNAEAQVLPDICPSIWQAYPAKSCVVDGMAGRMESIKAAGNGQVPCVAAAAWQILGGPMK